MNDATPVTPSTIREVRDACLCLATQRAARRLARRFDRAFRPVGLTNGQFSLMMFLAATPSQSPARLAELMAMDRTTITALLKSLQRRGFVQVAAGAQDRRRREVAVTESGRETLALAVPIWRAHHAALGEQLGADAAPGREFLHALALAPLPA